MILGLLLSSLQDALFSDWLLLPPIDLPEERSLLKTLTSMADKTAWLPALPNMAPGPRKELKDQGTGCLHSSFYPVNP